MFKYLESRDVDEVGYTLRTASLMTDPEYFFDDRDPSDYRLFGIRYLLLPADDQPPMRARLTMRSGPYWLWTIDGDGYIQAEASPPPTQSARNAPTSMTARPRRRCG